MANVEVSNPSSCAGRASQSILSSDSLIWSSEPASDGVSAAESPSEMPLCTLRCRRRLETTEKCLPQPSTSQANAWQNVSVWKPHHLWVKGGQCAEGKSRGKGNSRFSPVWLYMCVCRELGRVKRLSQTLHLCFFWVPDTILELKELIMDCGAGGWLDIKPWGRGSVRPERDSRSDPAVE